MLQAVGQMITAGKASVVGVADLDKTQLEQLYDWAHVSISLKVNTFATTMVIGKADS